MNMDAPSSFGPARVTVNAAYDPCSLVILNTGQRKAIPWEQKMDIARQAGVEFIRLVHKEQCKTNRAISGFQHVYIRWAPGRNGRQLTGRWAVDEWSGNPICEHSLNFAPNQAEQGIAYVPKSPRNMITLASNELNGTAPWMPIEDEKIAAEVRALAEEIRNSPEHKAAVERIERIREETRIQEEQRAARGDIVQNVDNLLAEKKVLENRLAEMTTRQEIEKLRAKVAELSKGAGQTQPPSTPVASPPAEEVDTSRKEAKELREQAKNDVYEANQELIRLIKQKHAEANGSTRGWARNPMYKKDVEPLIERRMKELAESADAGNS